MGRSENITMPVIYARKWTLGQYATDTGTPAVTRSKLRRCWASTSLSTEESLSKVAAAANSEEKEKETEESLVRKKTGERSRG